MVTELLDMTTLKWSDGPSYPFAGSGYGIYRYSATQTSEAVYIIGGFFTLNVVAEYKNDRWSRLRDLNQGRFGHGSISIGDYTMIIGGWVNGSEVT